MRLAATIWMIAAAFWLRTAFLVSDGPTSPHAVAVWESHGFGRTKEEAKDDAYHHAAEGLQAKIAERSPDAAVRKPSQELVKSLVVEGFEGETIEVPPIGLARRWVLRLRMPAETLIDRYVEDESRRIRAESRRTNAAIACGGVALVLGAVWAYRLMRTRRTSA
ncbi:MAG: hypothetical protein K2X38_10100 [Gemmataceae bacterium]|nr:hypothetical protein [Gemmataceae bacterium]